MKNGQNKLETNMLASIISNWQKQLLLSDQII